MEWFPWYPLDFRRKTYHLSLAEDGAYRRLIDEYMLNRGALPNNDAALSRILGIALPEWMAVSENVRLFFKTSGDFLIHPRCEEEIRAQNTKLKRFSERGKKAAFAKYSKINQLTARRMLVSPTLHNNSKSLSSLETENAETPKGPTEEKEKKTSVASESLKAVMREKLARLA